MIDRSSSLSRRLRGSLAAAMLAFGTVTAAPAVADDRFYLSILATVYSIEASPYWTAKVRGLAIDEERSTITIDSLTVAAERGGVVVNIEDATLDGYTAGADGGFTAGSLAIARATVSTAGTKTVFNNVRVDDLGVPALSGVAYDRTKPFSSLIGAYAAIAKTRSAGATIDEVAIEETDKGVTSLISYRDVFLGALVDGRLESASAAPLTLRAPAAEPLAEMSAARVEAEGIDLDAFLHVFDPLRYVAGTGDGQWRRAVERARYDDLMFTVPGVKLTIGAIAIDGLTLRQPDESFAPLIDALTAARQPTPLAMSRLRSTHLGKLVSSFGVGRFAVDGVVVDAGGIDQLTLGGLELEDASTGGFGKIAVQDFVAAITGKGAAQAGSFALGDLVLPPSEALDAAIAAAERGGDVDISALTPKLGFVEASDIYLAAIDFPGLALDRMRADFDNHVGTVPTAISVDIEGIDMATASLPNARLRGLISSLGYERIGASAKFGLNWHEADSTVSLDAFELDIADFGNATADLELAGLTREAIEAGDDSKVLDELRFERARITFEDHSVVDRSLSMRADLLNIPLERLKHQLSGALPLMLAVLGEQAKAIVPVLQDFIKTPGTLVIEATPETPVPVNDIAEAVHRPQTLPGLLGISVTDGRDGKAAAEDVKADGPAGDTAEADGPSEPAVDGAAEPAADGTEEPSADAPEELAPDGRPSPRN